MWSKKWYGFGNLVLRSGSHKIKGKIWHQMVDFGVKMSRKHVFFKVSSYSYTKSAPDASSGGFSKTMDPTHEHRMGPRTNAPCSAKNIGPQKEEALIGATGNTCQ